MAKVTVSDVKVAVPTTPGVEAGMVTLREDAAPNREISIVIGQAEARAINSAWSGAIARRPSTWDLLITAVGVLGGRLDRVVITSVEEGRHYFSNIELTTGAEGPSNDAAGPEGDTKRVVAARPSDAIALALRSYGTEIFVAGQVYADLGMGEAPIDN